MDSGGSEQGHLIAATVFDNNLWQRQGDSSKDGV
jgi:hypothetical protein